MTLTQVLYALAVARYLNFSRAADSLFVSQPALSLQIKNLEKELGYDLFARTPHGILLTELGEEFCRDAQAVANQWEAFQQKVRLFSKLRGIWLKYAGINVCQRIFSHYWLAILER